MLVDGRSDQRMSTNYFGEDVAARYDDPDDEMSQAAAIDPVVDFIAELAGDGAALELGIGTGRIALPLAQRGVRVHGIDLSEAMVARLQAKPGAEAIGVTIGDFATTTVEGRFSVAYLVFNTIMNLTTQDAQVACFRNVAAHLEPGGCFVIEVMLPDLQRLPAGETFRPFTVTPTHLGFDEYDVVAQGLISHHYCSHGRGTPGQRDSVSLRVAGRARSDGAARRDDAARALERLDTRAVHGGQHQARLRVGEDGLGVVAPRYARNGAGQASILGIEKRAIVPKPSAGLHACATPASQATERKMNASSIVKSCWSTRSFAASSETSARASA